MDVFVREGGDGFTIVQFVFFVVFFKREKHHVPLRIEAHALKKCPFGIDVVLNARYKTTR